MAEEFAKLSVPELESLIERARAEIGRRKEAAKATLLDEFQQKLKSLGLEMNDILPKAERKARKTTGAKTKTVVAPKKYRNPDNHDQVWSGGRGPIPAWVTETLASKKITKEQFMADPRYLNPAVA